MVCDIEISMCDIEMSISDIEMSMCDIEMSNLLMLEKENVVLWDRPHFSIQIITYVFGEIGIM